MGNASAQDKLAQYYFYLLFVPKCARYYAEKAAHQGEMTSQYVLAQLIKDSGSNEVEVFWLYTLAAFQGSAKGRFALGMHYIESHRLIETGDEDWRMNMLLTVYWFGKTAEVGAKTPERYQSMAMMTLHLDDAMKEWHPKRVSDPLSGYSHISFITWALDKGGKYTDMISSIAFGNVNVPAAGA